MQEPAPVPHPQWEAVPRAGCVNVAGKVLLLREGLGIAMLKFEPHGTIDEHAAPHEIDVVCLEGAGYISIDERAWAFTAGLTLSWPAGRLHRLWTGDQGMVTLMVERPGR